MSFQQYIQPLINMRLVSVNLCVCSNMVAKEKKEVVYYITIYVYVETTHDATMMLLIIMLIFLESAESWPRGK